MPQLYDTTDRLIFHVDVNSAFLSWEAVDRLCNGETLDLRTVPSCVGGDPERRTSIVSTKSIPAKKYGIVTGEPVATALRKCPDLIVVKPNFELYKRMSHAFKSILNEYTPLMQSFSIDEVFMDMTGMGLLYPDPIKLAYEMKDRIRDELGFTVNVGIARNKLCAKMASDFEKPDKVHTLFPDEIEDKMWPLPVGELFGCGQSTAKKLIEMRINTIGDLAGTDEGMLLRAFGEKTARYLHDAANGIDDSLVINEEREAKSYSIYTVKHLRELYPEGRLWFIMGSDMLLSFEKWYCWEELLSLCTPLCLARCTSDAMAALAQAEKLSKMTGISSTVSPTSILTCS